MHYTSQDVYKYISKKHNDPILEWRTCRRTWETFPIYEKDTAFLQKLRPSIWTHTFDLPLPTLSPRARQIRRLLRRNERHLYRNSQGVIALYHPSAWYEWVDITERTTLDQTVKNTAPIQAFSWETIDALTHQSIHPNTSVLNMENSDYTNQASNLKNCYLVFATWWAEDCMYGRRMHYSKNCIDCLYIAHCSLCYECIKSSTCHSCLFWYCLESCTNCYFCTKCINCTSCFWCTNLVWKQYCRYNEQLTKEQYEQKTHWCTQRKISYQQRQTYIARRRSETYYRTNDILQSEYVTWNGISNSTQAHLCWDISSCEQVRYCNDTTESVQCMDISFFGIKWLQKSYEWSIIWLQSSDLYFCNDCRENCSHLYYCNLCWLWSHHCFWCVWLINKSYCIYNVQYTKEQYEQIVPKIITHMQKQWLWGEFFPPHISMVPYNDSIAYEYFPLHKIIDVHGNEKILHESWKGTVTLLSQESIAKAYINFWWENIQVKRRTKETEINIPESIETITLSLDQDLPHQNDIFTKAFICNESQRPYRITKQEMTLYKHFWLPLPRYHQDIRHHKRMNMLPKRSLHLRSCDKTWEHILSVYPQESPFKVYSEHTYQQEMYG